MKSQALDGVEASAAHPALVHAMEIKIDAHHAHTGRHTLGGTHVELPMHAITLEAAAHHTSTAALPAPLGADGDRLGEAANLDGLADELGRSEMAACWQKRLDITNEALLHVLRVAEDDVCHAVSSNREKRALRSRRSAHMVARQQLAEREPCTRRFDG